MASNKKMRSVTTQIWLDNKFENLPVDGKLLFLYFLTNDMTNVAGIYEASLRRISFDTGIEIDRVETLCKGFETLEMVFYVDGYVILPKFQRHQRLNDNMRKSIISVVSELPEKVIDSKYFRLWASFCDKPLLKGMETLCKGFETHCLNKKEEKGKRKKEKGNTLSVGKKTVFKPPTVTEVTAYCNERGNAVDPVAFVDFYTSKGWLVGKVKMKDWKAAVRTWERNGINRGKKDDKLSTMEMVKYLDDMLQEDSCVTVNSKSERLL